MLESKRSRTSQDSQPGQPPASGASMRVKPQRQPLPSRAQSYAPTTAYSARQAAAASASAVPKKRRNLNLGSKIETWWSAVTKTWQHEEGKSGSSGKGAASTTARPSQPRAASDSLTVSADPTEPTGRISAQYPRESRNLAPPAQAMRHTSSTSDLKAEAKAYSVSQPPSGALAPAARSASTRQSGEGLSVSHQPHSRVNSAGSEGDGSSGTGSATRSEFRRRNPQLSLRLDPRFQQATALKLGEKHSNESSERSSSASGGRATQQSPAFFKEPRPPPRAYHGQGHEQTPSLTPGQSPLWDRTPGLVPVSQMNAMRLSRSASKQALQPTPPSQHSHKSPQQTLAPTFSMSHIRDHIKHRLSGAKGSCDKELRKVIVGITTYVERDLDNERAFDIRAESRQELADASEVDVTQQQEVLATATEDTGNDAEDELDSKSVAANRPALLRHDTSSSGSHPPSSHPSRVGSPSSHPTTQPRRVTNPPNRGRSSGHSSPRRFSLQAKRGSPGMVRPADLAARLEKSLDLGGDESSPVSQASSRSTSRSRSPMPGLNVGSAPQRNSSAEWHHRRNPHSAAEEDKRHFLHSLQAMVAIAQEIVDTSVKDLTDDPSTCAQLIKRVQKIGKKWDDHSHWPLRGWYVQLLLAVAGLSRVSEFWAEERGFWNFSNNEQDDNDSEPILFVAKAPAMEEQPSQTGSARSRAVSASISLPPKAGAREEPQATSLGIDLGIHRVEEEAGDTSMKVTGPPAVDESGATRAEEAEVLREAVEEVRNATILMELALDGESFQYISPVWEDVVG